MSTKQRLLAAWDPCDIATHQAKFLVEEAAHNGEPLDEDTAFQLACQDADLYHFEWECLTDYLTELINARNPDATWYCDAHNFGWRSLDGYKYFSAETGADFLRAILPDCDCTFNIFDHANEKGFAIQNFHHDSPVGKEWYYVVPDTRLACVLCGDLHEPQHIKRCPQCKDYLCDYCYGLEPLCHYCHEDNNE